LVYVSVSSAARHFPTWNVLTGCRPQARTPSRTFSTRGRKA
jgi:hypothetical protein